MTSKVTVLYALLTLAAGGALSAQERRAKSYELRGGWWLDGSRFLRKAFYAVDGIFRDRRPARVDSVIDLADAYVVPAFGDAHTHAFDNPATIGVTVEANSREGIFYALSLTNSIAGKRAVAASVNRRPACTWHTPTPGSLRIAVTRSCRPRWPRITGRGTPFRRTGHC